MGRAPWPVTVVLRLVSPGAKQVGRPDGDPGPENRHGDVVLWGFVGGWICVFWVCRSFKGVALLAWLVCFFVFVLRGLGEIDVFFWPVISDEI